MTEDRGMTDDQPKKRPLSEIGHLFLSSVRDRQMGGVTPPQRTPPGGRAPAAAAPQPVAPPVAAEPALDVDGDPLTPEDFEQVFGHDDPSPDAPDASAPIPPVTAIVSAHLGGRQVDRLRQYAR